MYKILLAAALISSQVISAQTLNITEGRTLLTPQAMSGAPFSSTKYVSVVSGHPYFSETWMKGRIITLDSAVIENLMLRMNVADNQIVYRNEKNEEMVSVAPVKAVILFDPAVGKDVTFEEAGGVFYQQLTDGPASLFKQYSKRIVESKAYASSVTEQTIVTDEQYYIRLVTGMARIKKPADLAIVFPAKATEIKDYASKQKLTGKKEAHYIAVVDYFNTLVP